MCGRVSVSTLCGDKLCVRCVCVRVCVCACACRSCDGEGRKDKGGGEKVRDVKTVVWIKLSIRMYVCRYLCISRMHVFSTEHDVQERQHLRDEVGTWQRTTQNNGLSLLLRHGDIIMKTASFGITDG